MDFDFSEEQDALRDLAAQIFEGRSSVERVTDVERTDDRFDRELWLELAKANLLGVALPEAHGGLGFGIMELALVAEQQGRRVAPVPLVPTLVLGAAPIARFGPDALGARWLPGVIAGDVVLTGAYANRGVNDPRHCTVTATLDGDAWVLDGDRVAVPASKVAHAVLVPARTAADELTVFVVPTDGSGVSLTHHVTTDRELHGTLQLAGVRVGADAVVGAVGQGHEIVAWTIERADTVNAAIALGCCEEAVAMTAAYVSQREQFGRPLSTNQAVAQRAADAYIDTDCIRLTVWQAAWRLDEGLPAADAVAVAKWFAAEAGQRVVHATQHLHGGMGADVDYPVHRYFVWVKQLENVFGGGSQQLARLGARIAATAKA